MKEYLDKLEELTNGLPAIPFASIKRDNEMFLSPYTDYAVKQGSMKMMSLYSCENISIAKGFMTKDTVIQKHLHEGCYEIIIILEGKMIMYMENKITEMDKLDKIIISVNQPHTAVAIEDCSFVALTVPKDEGFPE